MKTTIKTLLVITVSGAAILGVVAQERPMPPKGGQGGPGMGGQRPPPVIAALDANRDGVLDAEEIANASKALLSLDKNGDGKLTQEELRLPRPEGQDGPPVRQ